MQEHFTKAESFAALREIVGACLPDHISDPAYAFDLLRAFAEEIQARSLLPVPGLRAAIEALG